MEVAQSTKRLRLHRLMLWGGFLTIPAGLSIFLAILFTGHLTDYNNLLAIMLTGQADYTPSGHPNPAGIVCYLLVGFWSLGLLSCFASQFLTSHSRPRKIVMAFFTGLIFLFSLLPWMILWGALHAIA